jgi:hypothetical protein
LDAHALESGLVDRPRIRTDGGNPTSERDMNGEYQQHEYGQRRPMRTVHAPQRAPRPQLRIPHTLPVLSHFAKPESYIP